MKLERKTRNRILTFVTAFALLVTTILPMLGSFFTSAKAAGPDTFVTIELIDADALGAGGDPRHPQGNGSFAGLESEFVLMVRRDDGHWAPFALEVDTERSKVTMMDDNKYNIGFNAAYFGLADGDLFQIVLRSGSYGYHALHGISNTKQATAGRLWDGGRVMFAYHASTAYECLYNDSDSAGDYAFNMCAKRTGITIEGEKDATYAIYNLSDAAILADPDGATEQKEKIEGQQETFTTEKFTTTERSVRIPTLYDSSKTWDENVLAAVESIGGGANTGFVMSLQIGKDHVANQTSGSNNANTSRIALPVGRYLIINTANMGSYKTLEVVDGEWEHMSDIGFNSTDSAKQVYPDEMLPTSVKSGIITDFTANLTSVNTGAWLRRGQSVLGTYNNPSTVTWSGKIKTGDNTSAPWGGSLKLYEKWIDLTRVYADPYTTMGLAYDKNKTADENVEALFTAILADEKGKHIAATTVLNDANHIGWSYDADATAVRTSASRWANTLPGLAVVPNVINVAEANAAKATNGALQLVPDANLYNWYTGVIGADNSDFHNRTSYYIQRVANLTGVVSFTGTSIQSTTASALHTDDHVGVVGSAQTITDVVKYKGLTPNVAYIIRTTIMSTDSKSVKGGTGANGHNYYETTFTPATANGEYTVIVPLTGGIDTTEWAGSTVTIYETICDSLGHEIATHSDIADVEQQVKYANLAIVATAEDGSHVGPSNTVQDIKITAKCTNLVLENQYNVVVNLYDAKTMTAIPNATATLSSEFVPKTDGTYEAKLTIKNFDSASYKQVVAIGVITHKGINVVNDADRIDLIKDQPDYPDRVVTFAGLNVSALSMTGVKYLDPIEAEGINATITYSSLEKGQTYSIYTRIWDSTAQQWLIDKNGKEISNTVTFKANEELSPVLFRNLNTAKAQNHVYVVVAQLRNKDGDIICETSKVNADATLTVVDPSVSTKLTDSRTGRRTANSAGEADLTDKVTYKNIIEDNPYVCVTTLMNCNSAPVAIQGATLEKEFDGKLDKDGADIISMQLTFDGTSLQGVKAVAYNELYRVVDGKRYLVVSEKDPANKDQTVYFPTLVSGVALDKENHTHTITYASDAAIQETAEYKGLVVGQTYKAVAELYDLQGVKVPDMHTGESEFKCESTDGSVIVYIPINSTTHKGKDYVVYITIYDGDRTVCAYKKKDDKLQQVSVAKMAADLTGRDMSGATTSGASATSTLTASNVSAAGTGSKVVPASKNTLFSDAVTYQHLTAGDTYILEGILMEPTTQTVLARNRMEFDAKSATGNLTMTFENVDTSELGGHNVVVINIIRTIDTESCVAIADDLNDPRTTVTINPPENGTPGDPPIRVQTGVAPWTLIFGSLAVVFTIGGVVLVRRRKRQ